MARYRDFVPRTLTWLLRHSAKDHGLEVSTHGWVSLRHILKLEVMQRTTLPEVLKAVKDCKKKRFEVQEDDGHWLIRATQGHSLRDVSDQMHRQVTSVEDLGAAEAVHGTFLVPWLSIRREGLKSMGRNHIHLCLGAGFDGPDGGVIGQGEVISGMRTNVDVLIWVDMEAVFAAGMDVFVSPNGVVLTDGEDGVISPKFFSRAAWRAESSHHPWRRGEKKEWRFLNLFEDGRDITDESREEDSDFDRAVRAALPSRPRPGGAKSLPQRALPRRAALRAPRPWKVSEDEEAAFDASAPLSNPSAEVLCGEFDSNDIQATSQTCEPSAESGPKGNSLALTSKASAPAPEARMEAVSSHAWQSYEWDSKGDSEEWEVDEKWGVRGDWDARDGDNYDCEPSDDVHYEQADVVVSHTWQEDMGSPPCSPKVHEDSLGACEHVEERSDLGFAEDFDDDFESSRTARRQTQEALCAALEALLSHIKSVAASTTMAFAQTLEGNSRTLGSSEFNSMDLVERFEEVDNSDVAECVNDDCQSSTPTHVLQADVVVSHTWQSAGGTLPGDSNCTDFGKQPTDYSDGVSASSSKASGPCKERPFENDCNSGQSLEWNSEGNSAHRHERGASSIGECDSGKSGASSGSNIQQGLVAMSQSHHCPSDANQARHCSQTEKSKQEGAASLAGGDVCNGSGVSVGLSAHTTPSIVAARPLDPQVDCHTEGINWQQQEQQQMSPQPLQSVPQQQLQNVQQLQRSSECQQLQEEQQLQQQHHLLRQQQHPPPWQVQQQQQHMQQFQQQQQQQQQHPLTTPQQLLYQQGSGMPLMEGRTTPLLSASGRQQVFNVQTSDVLPGFDGLTAGASGAQMPLYLQAPGVAWPQLASTQTQWQSQDVAVAQTSPTNGYFGGFPWAPHLSPTPVQPQQTFLAAGVAPGWCHGTAGWYHGTGFAGVNSQAAGLAHSLEFVAPIGGGCPMRLENLLAFAPWHQVPVQAGIEPVAKRQRL